MLKSASTKCACGKKATISCDQCGGSLCDECNSIIHSVAHTKNHNRTPIENGSATSSSFKPRKCSTHGEKLVLFCQKDHQFCCSLCTSSPQHENHKMIPISDLSHSLLSKGEMKKDVSKMKTRCEEVRRAKEKVSKMMDRVIEVSFLFFFFNHVVFLFY